MRYHLCVVLVLTCFIFPSFTVSAETIHMDSEYNQFLNRHVVNGVVNYGEMKADSLALDRYLKQVANVTEAELLSWDEKKRLAFLFNLYNAATIKMILDHYPVKSIKDIGSFFTGPWDQPVVQLFGKTITLDTLEHKILRKSYNEPRLHMALVCAAKGCPPLRNELYTELRLDEQLDDQTVSLLNDPLKFKIDRDNGAVYFSSIFKWYGDDFIQSYTPAAGFEGLSKKEKAIANFCTGYLSATDRGYLMSGKYRVKYLDYDWTLNE